MAAPKDPSRFRPCETPGCPNSIRFPGRFCFECQSSRKRLRDTNAREERRNPEPSPREGAKAVYETMIKIASKNL